MSPWYCNQTAESLKREYTAFNRLSKVSVVLKTWRTTVLKIWMQVSGRAVEERPDTPFMTTIIIRCNLFVEQRLCSAMSATVLRSGQKNKQDCALSLSSGWHTWKRPINQKTLSQTYTERGTKRSRLTTWSQERLLRRGNTGSLGQPNKYLQSAYYMNPVVKDLESTHTRSWQLRKGL